MSLKKSLVMMLVVALMVVLVVWHALPAEAAPPAQGDAPSRTITVTGRGIAYGAPDVARVGLGVQSSSEDVLEAMNDANARMNAVMQALQAGGVDAADIRTESFSIYQEYPFGGPGAPGMEGERAMPFYRVMNGVQITVRDTEGVAELMAAAVEAGANMVNYVQFDIDDRAALESEARDLAVTDARARAEELAGLLGLSVGEAVNVVEGGQDFYHPMMGGGGGGAAFAGAPPPISQGTLSVSMSVTITFALTGG